MLDDRMLTQRKMRENGDICYSKHNVQYVLMFCMHQKHVYHSCYDYYIHFNIHIELMSHYDIIISHCILCISIMLHLYHI